MRSIVTRFAVLTLLAFLSATVPAQVQDIQILRGLIRDANGDPVPEALVVIKGPRVSVRCPVGDDGRFECSVEGSGDFDLMVSAEGFASIDKQISTNADFSEELLITLQAAPLREQVVVSAEGSPSAIGETAASVAMLTSEDLQVTAAPSVDDALRQTPGFTLYRRSSSRTANPTTQGASLRGINPSGASRSLVLLDSVPLNDPFGGWIPWSSVPRIAIESVEVLRGGSSSLYGSDSIGGTIVIRRRPLKRRNVFASEAYAGSSGTGSGSFFGGLRRKWFEGDLVASVFKTDGYVPVERPARGTADQPAGTRDLILSGRISPNLGSGAKAYVRGSYFAERRKNGTRLQRNRTVSRRLEAGLDPAIGDIRGTASTALSFRAYGIFQVFDQTFSAVADDRNSESLVRLQRVPSQSVGLSARFATTAGSHAILAGAEVRNTKGASEEIGFFGGNRTSETGSGGGETGTGLYFQDRVSIADRFVLTGRVRFDSWNNYGGLRTDLRLATGERIVTRFEDRNESAVDPGVSLLARISDRVSAYFNASRSFRAPTLNELYRGFRVGNIVTLSNADLRAEKATNVEGGVSYWVRDFGVHASVFRSAIGDAVTNVTIDASATPILRQRQNAAKVLVRGFEAESEFRAGFLSFSAGYLFSDARYTSFPAERDREGNLVPQSARHNVTFQIRYSDSAGTTIAAQARASSSQFDDDLNRFRLGPYFQLDLSGGFRITTKTRVFAAAENILNSRYTVGLTPVRTISSPLTFRAGIRWN